MVIVKVGQTVHLMGGDIGTVEDIRQMSAGAAYQINVGGESHWVGEVFINEERLEQQSNPVCHYCGSPATDWDFFNAPVCKDCR